MKAQSPVFTIFAAAVLLAGCVQQRTADEQQQAPSPRVIGTEPTFNKMGDAGCPEAGSELFETAEGQLICLPPEEGCPEGELSETEAGELICRPPERGCPENLDTASVSELSPECRIRRREGDGGGGQIE